MRLIVLLFSLLVVSIGQSTAQQKSYSLTDQDKALILKTVLVKEDLLKRGLTVDETLGVVSVSLENIKPKLLPKLTGISFVLFNREQIKTKTKTGFLYYAFGPFKVQGSKVLIEFGRYFENTDGGTSYSEGLTYEFRKVKGKWKGIQIEGFGSST